MKKKFFTKLLSIALVCVMMIMCMGAAGGEQNLEYTDNKQIILKSNNDGTYSQDKLKMFNISSDKIIVEQNENKPEIFTANNNNMYLEVESNSFVPVAEKTVKLIDLDLESEVKNFPTEVYDELKEAHDIAKQLNDDEVSVQYYLKSSDDGYHLVPSYTVTYDSWGYTYRHYELYFINENTSYFNLVSGRNVTEHVLDAIVQIISCNQTVGTAVSLFNGGKTLLDIFHDLTSDTDIVVKSTDNKVQAKVTYDLYTKHTYWYDPLVHEDFLYNLRSKKVVLDETEIVTFLRSGQNGIVEERKFTYGGTFYSENYLSPEEKALFWGNAFAFYDDDNIEIEIGGLKIELECPYYSMPGEWPGA